MNYNFHYDDFEENLEKEGDSWSDNFFEEDGSPLSFDDQNINTENVYPDQLNADQLGTAMAFGEMLADENKVYDVDENTDRENWEGVMKLYPLQGLHDSTNTRRLSKFEQYINDITSGRQKGPWHRD